MRANLYHAIVVKSALAASILFLAGGAAFAQSVGLTAAPTSATLPDGQVVPMWGYSCGTAAAGATCAALNANAGTGWSPVVITVPYTGSATSLTINLTNSLSFGSNSVPTSLVIVGQLGGGLGSTPTRTPSPTHAPQGLTWPIAGQAGGTNPTFTPPPQPPRVQSFATEVAAGATTALTWSNLKPGTYLIESGTHPSIQGPMGLYGMLVVTAAPAADATTHTETAPGTAYPGIAYDTEIPLLFSEIDAVQNAAVDAAVRTAGFSETRVWSGQPGGCGDPTSASYRTCYPPAVNYDPRYYLVNGTSFDRTHGSLSLFATTPANATGTTLLVRLVNAGLRMHVPSIVGAQTADAGGATVNGLALVAEDGNLSPGNPKIQSEVFMAAGKTFDALIKVPTTGTALPIFARDLSLSTDNQRDGGMQAYISANGAGLPGAAALTAVANPDSYYLVTGNALTVSDPAKGVIANDVGVAGVTLLSAPTGGTVTLNADGTFAYVPNSNTTSDSFTYCANGTVSGGTCSSGLVASVTLAPCTGTCLGNAPTANPDSYSTNVATRLQISPPGVLDNDVDPSGLPLTAAIVGTPAGGTVTLNADGSFTAVPACAATSCAGIASTVTFQYNAVNSQKTASTSPASVTVTFAAPTGLTVTVIDGKDKKTAITDYRWIIEEDRTFFIDPTKTTNTGGTTIVPTFGVNFHTSYMPVVATGCTGTLSCETGQTVYDADPNSPTFGQHVPAVCDVGNGSCRPGTQQAPLDPSQIHLDPTKRYYLSILPGDAANPFITANTSADCINGAGPAATAGNTDCGHGMGGAPIAAGQTALTVLTQPTPFPTAKLSVFVFEDDFPLNGEQDGGGGIDVLSPNEPGLGGFEITLFDDAGGPGDPTGQMTYDMFNMPLSNSLAGTIDPATGFDACPISPTSKDGIVGRIVTCPKYEAGKDSSGNPVLSPLAGQAVVANLMPGRYGVVAVPAADRIGKGEEWLQTNTLDGQKAHDSFLRIAEPSYFQEYGPAGYHVSIGFANPAIITARKAGVCAGTDPNITGTNCTNTITGTVTTERMSRTPDERLYSSGSNDSFSFTQCYVSFGDPDGEDFAFTKCDGNGNFKMDGLPDGDWRITVFDQWNDMLVDGLSTPVRLDHTKPASGNLGQIAMNQWQANIYTSSFIDLNHDGVREDGEPGVALVPTNIRFRDGSFSNFNNTDFDGNAAFNEVFPLFSWYVIETDSTRYKNTGTHVVYDAGGPADGTCTSTTAPCGSSNIGKFMANTAEQIPLPTNLRVPGAVYCDNADCTGFSIGSGPIAGGTSGAGGSTGRIDPPWVLSEGWQGFSGQNSFVEFGKTPYVPGENGGIHGHVVYASTRPFDDPSQLLQTSWEPLVPHVTINLYQEGTAPDGTQSLTLVDTTQTSSFDDWAQGFRSDGMPNMNCPGQGRDTGTDADLFFFSIYNQPNYLDAYNNGGTPAHTLPYNSQFKCYDGMHNWNQVQPAPYDGMYQFPSVTTLDPTTGKPTGTNCKICVKDPDVNDPYRSGAPMLPDGKYVVEVVVPPGYELVKEEDKNILIGDNYIAPVTQQFAGLGNIFILPDQAAVNSAYNANNAQNPTQSLGTNTFGGIDATKTQEQSWPCVGKERVVPDYISLFPQSQEVAPFAGATRPLCDRKEVTLTDQTSALAKFYIFTSTHAAAHFTGVITDDYTSEFDPFSPQFGEKFSPPDLPISIKDWTGNEISRIYSDHWGAYNGLNYSTWEVNPPNPTGYAPTMMVTCMNDPGSGATPDPLFNPAYSQFCYEIPFMPGQTQYMDTPVVPTSAFAGAGYNNPDCALPDTTPAISEVDGDGNIGPWVSASGSGHTLTIKALGDQVVGNNAYSGPSVTTAPYNQKTVTRHYGFGGTAGTVSIGGVTASVTGWSDTQITVTVPNGVPACAVQQQQQFGGPTGNGNAARCGELVITAANGKQSLDAVTVTIGGKAPTRLATGQTIQSAIDAAAPGDMIIVPPGVYKELLLMWKPIRLQGVGAASSVINANTHPAGKLDDWRRQVNCLFGLALDGTPITSSHPYDPTNTYSCPGTNGNTWNHFTARTSPAPDPQIDRLPLEATVGWDANLNGNLAELLQEPSLMGALEGAGITVLSKGVNFHGQDPFAASLLAGFPTGTTLLTSSTRDCGAGSGNGSRGNGRNAFPSSFQCNPSSIDGLSVTDGSQGGGGVFVHGWGHNIQIANNRIYNNAGTFSGGINVGQGEHPGEYLGGATAGAANAPPGSCQSSNVENVALPYCFDLNVNIHNNAIMLNSSTGDELFSATPAGAGGVSFASGSDNYQFQHNWVCGNLSSGDGGGFGHIGLSFNGDIEHNAFLFNQSTNPTIAANGGGLIIMGAPDADPPCGATTDADCVPADLTTIGPSDGVGPGMVINANLIMGNQAESGSGGGIAFQSVNGSEVVSFPNTPSRWYSVLMTNNIIANNVAGWDGAGVSLLDALNVNVINNTIMSNDSTGSSGVLFNTIGAPLASTLGANCIQPGNGTASCAQPAGLVSIQNSAVLSANLPANISCPTGHPNCRKASYPLLYNDVFWQNRSYYIGVGTLGTGTQNQQNVVALYNAFTTTQAPSQPQADATSPNGNGVIITGGTGACTAASFWDIGVRGDTGPSNHDSTVTLAPTYSVLTDIASYSAASLHNTNANPTVLSQYCNGSRVPPELGSMGYQVPPGISDATVPNPIFNLTPAATVDEGNNWINIAWGPLTENHPITGVTLGNYGPAAGSPVINYISSTASTYAQAPSTDYYGTQRKTNHAVDAGAVEFAGAGSVAVASVTGGPVNFGNVPVGTTSAPQTLTLHNTGTADLTGITLAASSDRFSQTGGTCTTTLTPATGTCTIIGVFSPNAVGTVNATLTITANVPVTGSPVALSGTGVVPGTVSITPNPLTITVPTGSISGTGTVTLTNTSPSGGASVTVTNVSVSGGSFLTYFFSRVAGQDACTGSTLAPGATCTVGVRFTNVFAARGVNRSGTITFTDNASGSPQTGALVGHAN